MNIRGYFSSINNRQRQLVLAQQNIHTPLNISRLYQLTGVSGCLFLVAIIGYFIGGYHFGFHPVNAMSADIPEAVLHNITVFGDGTFLLALVLLFSTKNPRFHWAVFLTAIIGGLVSNILKEYFDASRPPAVLTPESFNLFGKGYKHHSFPSGHTLTAFLMATVVYYHATKLWQRFAVIGAAALVGLSRIWLGVHWPIDTLVGGGLGVLAAIAAIVVSTNWPKGVNVLMSRVVLVLLTLAALILLLEKNDYTLALPLLYLTAIAALYRTIKHYLLPQFNIQRSPLEATQIKLPFVPAWVNSHGLFWFCLCVLVLYRLAILFQPHLSLFYDEAYYYHWSLNPDLGYYSKPPMVAWSILLSTSLFGDSVIAIKLMANLSYAASAAVIFYTLKRYSSTTIALVASLIFITIPMVGFNSAFITTDAPLFLFWCLSLHFALKAIDSNRLNQWMLLGFFTGCGMLSKYTMGALPLAIFAFLLTSTGKRKLLITRGPWVAAVIAGLVFSLNIYWNFAHNWVALHHTQEISQTSGQLFNLKSLLEFVATQFLIFGAISSYLLIKSIQGYRKRPVNRPPIAVDINRERFNLLLWVMLTILGVIALQAFLSRAFPNWAGPWMVAATLLLGFTWQYAFKADRFYTLLGRSLVLNLVLLSLFYHWPSVLHWLDVEPSSKNDPYHRVAGWPQLGEQLQPVLKENTNVILASNSRDLLAYLGYYAMPGSFKLARWNPDDANIRDYYDLKVNFRNWAGDASQAFIFISKAPLEPTVLAQFNTVALLPSLSYSPYKGENRSVSVYRMTGFKGYAKND